MFEQNNNLIKGLNSDFSPVKQPENTYREAKNFVRLSDVGDYYSLTNEKGTEVYCELPNDYSVIGKFVLESDIILVLVKNDLSSSQIGIVASNGTYTVKLDDINNELDLDLDHPIDIEARVLINSNRVTYFVDNKNPFRTIDLDNPPVTGKIDKLSSLIPVSDFAIIASFEVRDSITTLKCGAYQFLFRYLDDKGNVTNISIPSALASIGQNSVSAGNQYQGGAPVTVASKSIILNITNIDTDYRKLEIIAVHYDQDNQIIINSTAQVDIDSTTKTYEYKGEVLYELTIEEILGTTTNYSTAKAIAQKDGRLIISNLKENATIESQLQTIANQITLKYTIDQQTVTAYKNGDNTAHKVGYKRGEVYAFGFGVIYKNGAKSLVYHIPAPYVNGINGTITNPANTGTKVLGTYLSTLTYPTGQNYPSNANNGILYHVMPTYQQEPPYGTITGAYPNLVATVSGSGNNVINILGIAPEFTDIAEWDDIKEEIQGIFIVRRRRDQTANTSIFSQGIANYMMDEFKINTVGNEDETRTITIGGDDFKVYNNINKVLKKTPFLGGIRLGDYMPYDDGAGYVWDGIIDGADGLQTATQPLQQSFVDSTITYPNQNGRNGDPNPFLDLSGPDNTTISQLYKDLLVFYSPEAQLLPRLEANTFTKIKRVASTLFSDTDVRFDNSSYEEEGAGAGNSHLDKYPMYFNSFSQLSVDTSVYDSGDIDISKNFYVPRNSVVTTDYGVDIDNTKQESFLFLQTSSANTYTNTERTFKYFAVRNNSGPDNDFTTQTNITKNIYEVISENTSQYGSVQGQEYVICKYIPYDQVGLPNLSDYDGTRIYGGDTYITRMSFTNKTPIQSKYFHKGTTAKWFDPVESHDNSFGREYIDLRSNIEFYVESSKNTDLRHAVEGGNLYYRFTDIDTALITNPEIIGDVNSYNNQYDFENTIQLFYSKSDISSSTNNHYKTRSIWSQQAILGELRDRYRDISPNDFYDLPFNTGEIWDSIVHGNILYLHTPKTLWRTYFNSIEQQISTAGSVVLGTGGVFPVNLPPQQVVTQQGGYAGTISQWGGCNTPFGYIFADSLQGKLFLLGSDNKGPSLEEISMNGLIRYTNDNVSVLENLYVGYRDNPFKSGDYGLLSAYDFEIKRWILVKNHPENSFALSYDPITKQFISNHDYSPNMLVARDNRLFGVMNSEADIKLYEHNKGNYGEFYGTIYPFSISIVINQSASNEKVFDNIQVHAESTVTTSNTKIQVYRSTGDTIEVYNDRQHTGVVDLIWNNTYGYLPARNEARVQYLRSKYNIKVPLNSLISDANAIFDANGDLISANIDQDKLYRDRMKGDYCIIKFIFDNENNYKLTLNEINTIFRKYYR